MSAWTTIQAEQMEATECQAHMGTQTDGPVKRAHAPRCSHPRRLWGGSTLTCVCYPAKGAFLCHFHQIVSSLWFSWHVETTGTFWLSLTLHILTSAVKTNKRLQSSDADCSRSLSWNLIRLQSAASNLGQLSAGDDIFKKGILLNSCSCWVFLPPVVARLPSAYLILCWNATRLLTKTFYFVHHSCMRWLPLEQKSWLIYAFWGPRLLFKLQTEDSVLPDSWVGEQSAIWWDYLKEENPWTIFFKFRGFRSNFGCGHI